MASDFGESQVFINNDDGSFTKTTNRAVIVDQNGMGASVGDYDNDGDMDWFVTSIYTLDVLDSSVEGGEALFGNRLYRNRGAGVFEDVSGTAGIEDGGWGWGSALPISINDGDLDIVHVNGWTYDKNKDFALDRTRFFTFGSPAMARSRKMVWKSVLANDSRKVGASYALIRIEMATSTFGDHQQFRRTHRLLP